MRGIRRALWGLLLPAAAGAQWRELTVGSEAELYVRAMQTRGVWNGEPAAIRGYGPQVLERWTGESVKEHPWASRFRNDSLWVWPLRPMVQASFNSAYPWGYNDGAMWQGKGVNVAATFGFGAKWRWISLRVEPVLFRAQNGNFQLLGDTTRGDNAFVDQQRPGTIDLPQRFGRLPYKRIDPGQSELRVDVGPVAAGVSTMNSFWGPGIRHSLLMGGNSAGFPHLFLGTSRAWRTPIGRLAGQLVYGKLSQSEYAPGAPTTDRFGSGLVASWQPPSGRGFEVGMSRFYHREWPVGGPRLGDLTVPFGSLFENFQVSRGGAADNQLISIFARWRAEEDGFEFFGEFGKNDRNGSGRDLALEPEHNSAWLMGFAKTYHLQESQFWMVRAEYANGRIGSIQRLGRWQSTFYDHNPITQGHTERGQLLGSPLLERSSGFEMAVDRWAPWGRAGLMVMQRTMPSDLSEGVSLQTARSQWYTELNAVRFVGQSELFARVGVVFDLNRTPGTDKLNSYLQAGARLGF
ncbi:MAG TPA: hypothetical protein VIK25_14145 [Gemmatimonadaceae bacterium]